MNKIILDAWDKHNKEVREWLSTVNNDNVTYGMLLENTLRILFKDEKYDYLIDNFIPSYRRITEIDNGDYQGTLVFVIGGRGYQPTLNQHWYTAVEYGSCSGCDTLQAIRDVEGPKTATKEQVEAYWTLCLHMIQKMKKMVDVDYEDVVEDV